MVPYRRSVEQPLLPYEKRLIAALGCSEQEYRQFAQEVERRSTERPEEYALIPDIRCDPTTTTGMILINIGISALFTAAAILLAPKPKQPDQIQQRQLGSRRGKDIYAPSFGFDSLQELAEYGQTVPIAFTRREGAIDSTGQDGDKGTGGLLISPELGWSRMKSWGGYQIAELVTLAGQGNMTKPDLAGIFLGNNALDGIYEDYFDFYWNSGFEALGSGSQIRAYNLRYGNLAIDGDRDNPGLSGADQVFYAPTRDALSQPAFCGAFTPSSQTRFGVFTGVPNGTPFRPNWRIISIVSGQESKTDRQLKNQQKKYVDPYLMDEHPFGGNSQDDDDGSSQCGMPGTGTNYARRIGIVEHIRGATVTTVTHTVRPDPENISEHPSWQNLKQEVDVEVGDEIKVLIGKGKQKEKPFSVSGIDDVDLSDIQSAIQSESARYDALFSRGSTWMIGRTTWRVIRRSVDEPYDAAKTEHNSDGIVITLECIECWSRTQKKIGIVDKDAITVEEYLPFTQEGDDIHEAWYPLLKYELGTFQNTRACDVTEIGIKSQVWSKFEGITNFNTVPSPGKLVEANQDKISLSEGKLTTFAHRMSFFALDVRPSNYDSSIGSNNGWVNVGPYLFAVLGNSPVDVYSFIRVQHPERKQFEYRLRPFNSAIFVEQSDGIGDVFVLDGARFGAQGWESSTEYGQFKLGARGYFAQPRNYFVHREMVAAPELISGDDGTIDIKYTASQKDTSTFFVDAVSITANETDGTYQIGDEIRPNTLSNILASALGIDPYFDNLAVGETAIIDGWDYTRESGREVFMKLHLIAYEQNYAHTVRNKWWRIESVELENPTNYVGKYSEGETFDKYATNANGVQFAFKYRFLHPTTSAGAIEETRTTRFWQKYSGLAEVSHYGDLISRSCDNNSEHEIVYVNESLAEEEIPQYDGCALAGLKLKSSDNFNQLDQLRCYMKNGIEVERLIDGDIASSNLLTDLLWYLITNKDTGAGNILNRDLVDKDLLTTTGRYLRANKLYWDDVIAESINLRTWLGNQAASVLCFVSLRNGKMAIEPALPYDGNYKINDSEPVTISAMFTEGNIIEDSLEITWLELEERKMFQAAIIYQQSRVNQFPEQKTLLAYYGTDNSDLPIEEFSFKHITSDEHAAKVARYFLSLRKHLTHTITFKTLPWGLNLEAGKFIRVASELSPYRPDNNGIVQPDGTIVAVSPLADGAYNVYYWERQTTAVSEGVLHVRNGKATELFNVVFSLKESAGSSSEIYQIEALDIDEDGIVTIKASNYAVDENGISQLAKDVLDTAGAITIEGPPND